MKFHVTGTWVETGALLPPEAIGPMLESAVIPSLQMFVEWEQQGKITGGVFAGERETAFVLTAASAEEVGALLSSLPFWGMMKWNVRPLQSFASCVQREQEGRTRLP